MTVSLNVLRSISFQGFGQIHKIKPLLASDCKNAEQYKITSVLGVWEVQPKHQRFSQGGQGFVEGN